MLKWCLQKDELTQENGKIIKGNKTMHKNILETWKKFIYTEKLSCINSYTKGKTTKYKYLLGQLKLSFYLLIVLNFL